MRLSTTMLRPRIRGAGGVVGLFLSMTVFWVLHARRLAAEPPTAHSTLERAGRVWTVAFSPDGKTAASAGSDERVKVWDLATGTERATLKGHTEPILSVGYGPDGNTLASGGRDKTVKLWDLKSGKELATLEGHTDWVFSVAVSPDGKTVASASADGTVRLWDATARKQRAELVGHGGCVRCVAFSPDGATVASASSDETVKLWDVAAGKERLTLHGHTHFVYSLAYRPDGKTLASGGGDRTIRLWDAATGKEQGKLIGHGVEAISLAYSPDGKTLALGSSRKTVHLWEVLTDQERATLPGHQDSVTCVAYSPNGKTLASTSEDQTVKLWNIPTLKKAASARSTVLALEELDDVWLSLGSKDAVLAYRALGTLVTTPEQAVSLMRQRLRPASKATSEEIGHRIADLDSDEYAVRERASEELEGEMDRAEPALRKVLREMPSLEVRRRIERLLSKAELIRALRAVEVLEHIGNSEAKKVLETLATGAESARLTEEAKASLARLDRRTGAEK